jgi:hypothetical protein
MKSNLADIRHRWNKTKMTKPADMVATKCTKQIMLIGE